MKHISDPKAANVNVPAQTPTGRLHLANPQLNIVNGSLVKINLDTITPGFTDGIEDLINHRILPGVAGFYQVNAQFVLESLIDQCRYGIWVTRSGVACLHAENLACKTGSSTSWHMSLGVSDVVYLTAIQFLEVNIWHLDGTDICDVLGVSSGTFLSVQRVR